MHMSRAAETLRWFLVPTMKAQQKKGHYVCVCTSAETDLCIDRDKVTDSQYLMNDGFDVFTHGMKRSLNPLGIISAIFKVKKVLQENSIDVIICHNPLGAIVGRIAAIIARTPKIIYFAHGLPCAPQQGKFSWGMKFAIEKILGYFTDSMIVMNNYDENLSKKTKLIKDPSRIYRIPGMGVDLTTFSNEDNLAVKQKIYNQLGWSLDRKFVISVGRLIKEKGGEIFIRSAIEVCQKYDDVCFGIAGQGPLYDKLYNLIERNGFSDRIKLFGWLSDVSEYVKASDVFCLPTYYNEGLPVSILEAMSCAKPCVVTRHRGCEDAVEDMVSGVLVSAKDTKELSLAIERIIKDDKLRLKMGAEARKRVEDIFEINKCTDLIVDAIEAAIG